MRLCNSGEMLDIGEFLSKYPDTAKEQANKIEILIRSLFTVEGQPLAPEEDVKKYNTTHNTDISKLQYLRLWAINLEQLVVDRLYAAYTGLQAKQLRKVNGQYMCDVTAKVFSTIPEGAIPIFYSISEIISPEGIHILNQNKIEISELYDTKEDTLRKEKDELDKAVEATGAVEEVTGTSSPSNSKIEVSPTSKENGDSLKYFDQTSGKEYDSFEEFLKRESENS
jgi:hypothetical protein